MAYYLRPRVLREQLLADDAHEEEIESNTEDEVQSSEYSSDDSSYDDSEEEMEVDMEEPSNNKRLRNARKNPKHGRTQTKFYGKDGFVWNSKCPSRRSVKQRSYLDSKAYAAHVHGCVSALTHVPKLTLFLGVINFFFNLSGPF